MVGLVTWRFALPLTLMQGWPAKFLWIAKEFLPGNVNGLEAGAGIPAVPPTIGADEGVKLESCACAKVPTASCRTMHPSVVLPTERIKCLNLDMVAALCVCPSKRL